MMKRDIGIGLLFMILGMASVAQAVGPFMENERQPGTRVEGPAPDLIPPPAKRAPRQLVVTGEVLRIQGAYYVLRERSGSEVSLQVDNNTKFNIIPKLGDKVDVVVTPLGRAGIITPAGSG